MYFSNKNNLKANIVHVNLNACGGSERLSVATLQALSELNRYDIEITTFEKPQIQKLANILGMKTLSAFEKVKKINIIKSLDLERTKKNGYDLTINTHGDILPYYHKYFSKRNAITYCHFPIAKYLLDSGEPEYMNMLYKPNGHNMTQEKHRRFTIMTINNYRLMLINSTVLTNSEFTRSAIEKAFGISALVLNPPVDVNFFRNNAFSLGKQRRSNTILVIARFHPAKKIENAIKLAKLLKMSEIESRMKIIGYLTPDRPGYYLYIKKMVNENNLNNYITFEINADYDKLISIMREANIYFHTLPGEPFGISTVEAMSAGLIPIVPDIGGHTEFVPRRYQFHTFGDAVKCIENATTAPDSERVLISDSVKRFSTENYIMQLKQVVQKSLIN